MPEGMTKTASACSPTNSRRRGLPGSAACRRAAVEAAHAQQIDSHGAAITWWAAASIVARSPAAMRRSSTSAPPMPTNAAPAPR